MKKAFLLTLLVIGITSCLLSVARNKVLLEIGTGTWCQYCPGAAMAAEDLIDNNHQVAVIEYHYGDSFANTDAQGRISYYGITGYPTAFFDGLNSYVGGSYSSSLYSSYLPRVNSRLAIQSRYTISASGSNDGNAHALTVNITKNEPDTNTNIKLHAAVTESYIQFNWQGQTHLEWVARKMVPNYSGTTVDLSGTTIEVIVPLTFTMNTAWNPMNCELVLFIQNNTTKEVLQCVKYSFPELFGANPVSLDAINFPNTYLTGTATQPLILSNYWSSVITGSMYIDNPNFNINGNNQASFTIQPHNNTTYNINFAPTEVGNLSGNLIINSNFPDNSVITIPLSGYAFNNTAPIVNNVSIAGVPVVTMLQTGTYQFIDADSDAEGQSTYQWYRIHPDAPTPVPITDATGITYRLQQADIGHYIVFKVTPVDAHSMPGTPVISTIGVLIEVLPPPQNLTATVLSNNSVRLNWERPNHFTRDFLGYRVFRNGQSVTTLANTNTLTYTDVVTTPGQYEYYVTSVFSNPISQSEPSNTVVVNTLPNEDDVLQVIESVYVFPNPTRQGSTVNINSKPKSQVEIKVFDVKGKLIQKQTGLSDINGRMECTLNSMNEYRPGIYFVKIKTSERTHHTKLIVLK